MKPLAVPDTHHLHAAQGWLALGNHLEANEELERITPRFRRHPDVLEVRWVIFAHAKKWKACVEIAESIIKRDRNRPTGWINRSFALRELNRTQEAFDKLRPVVDRFTKVWTIPYNLACYCAQLGRLYECASWFYKAMTIDKDSVKCAALNDPDLKPLWDSMSNTLRKRME